LGPFPGVLMHPSPKPLLQPRAIGTVPTLVLLDAVPAAEEREEKTAQHTPDPGLLQSASSGAPVSEGRAIAILPIARLKLLLERYVECAGPAARPILLSEIAKLEATAEHFPLRLRARLLLALASRLDDGQTRSAFIEDAQYILGGN
jgi:hypothetical protein